MGFDETRFTGKVDDDFRCYICYDIIEDPIASYCEHVFCKVCIYKWLEKESSCPVDREPLMKEQLCEPSRFFRNFYSKLVIKCEFASNGCENDITIENLKNHRNECKFNTNVKYECEKGCNALLTNNDIISHNCVDYLKSINLNLIKENEALKARDKENEELIRHLQIMSVKKNDEDDNLNKNLEPATLIDQSYASTSNNSIKMSCTPATRCLMFNEPNIYPNSKMSENQAGLTHQEVLHNKNVDINSQNVYGNLKAILPSESEFYWDIINKNFNVQAANFTSVHALEYAIKNYNVNLRNSIFVELHKLCFEDKIIIPKIIEHALKLGKMNQIEMLRQRDNKTIILSQLDISCLLANAFLCTFYETSPLCPNINFDRLFIKTECYYNSSNVKIEKLKCIMNYFKRVLSKPPKGMVSFERRYLQSHEIPKWNISTKSLSNLFVHSGGSIEKNGKDMLQVDFANKMVGGGILDNGCTQEEIRFCMNPELIISRLFTEVLLDQEVLIIKGTEQFNEYEGYGSTFKWRNNHYDKTSYDGQFRNTTIVAMDALKFSESEKFSQFNSINFNRELNKAYCGFMDKHYKSHQAIATGSWGCGVFNGNKILKAIIQLMAASESEKDLHYFTFGDNKLKNELEDLYNFFRNKHFQVRHLYKAVRLYDKHVISRSNSYKQNLIKYIMDSAYYIFK